MTTNEELLASMLDGSSSLRYSRDIEEGEREPPVSDERGRIPPLFWINNAGSGSSMSIMVSGRRVICFFSLELMAIEYAERHLGGQLGIHWYPTGSEDP